MNDEISNDEAPSTVDSTTEQEAVDIEGGEVQDDEAAQLAAWNDLLEEEAATPEAPALPDSGENGSQLDIVMEIPVTISLEIGRTAISIRNLLQLNQGSVVELDRLAGESLDVMVNGCLVAHGEVVMVNEKFGIRLTDIISPKERVKKLS